MKPSERQLELSVVVVNWNTRDLLKQCLDSVLANPPLGEFEIFVLDNASVDASAEMVRECFPQVHLIENHENVGFARANNQAIRQSNGRYVLLLNSDTIVQPGALSKIVTFMDAHQEAGIVGGNILNLDGTPQLCFGKSPSLVSETAFAWGLDTHFPFSMWFSPHLGIGKEHLETVWVVGAALMVRRQVLDRVGLLDESYFMYSEEVDLAYRVRHAGWKTYVVRDARIIHLGQQSSKQAPAAMKAQLFRSKVLYFQKHHGRAAGAILRVVFAIGILARCSVYRLQRASPQVQLWSETWERFIATKRQ